MRTRAPISTPPNASRRFFKLRWAMDSLTLAKALAARAAPPKRAHELALLQSLGGSAFIQARIDFAQALAALDQGADADARDAFGSNALMLLARHHGGVHVDFERLALALLARSNLRAQDGEGRSALCLASQNPSPAGLWMARSLLERGADPRHRCRQGLDPLGRACQGGSLQSIELLLPLAELGPIHRKKVDPAQAARGRTLAMDMIQAERQRRELLAHSAPAPSAPKARL